MTVDEIIEKQLYVSYKKLTEILEIQYYTGGSKIKQIEEINQQYVIKRRKSKYLIQLKKEIITPQFNIQKNDRHKSGIYKIHLNNIIYIGQTSDLKTRYRSHKQNYDGKHSKTQELLLNGGTFEIIEFTYGLNQKEIDALELKYIKFYKNNQDYICLNVKSANRIHTKTIRVGIYDYFQASKLLKEGGIKIYDRRTRTTV